MLDLGPLSAARLASLATGRGGMPSAGEWPLVLLLLAVVAFLGTRFLLVLGLTRLEAILVAALAPLLVLIDAPLGELSPRVSLAANVAGCVIPMAVALKVFWERRLPLAEGILLVCVGIIVSYFSSHVVPDRGVLLQYRVPAVVIGVLAAGLLYARPERAGAGGFAAGAMGVTIGADVMRLAELADGGIAGRVILGGAGLLDGILLVAVLSAAVGECTAVLLRSAVRLRTPSEPVV